MGSGNPDSSSANKPYCLLTLGVDFKVMPAIRGKPSQIGIIEVNGKNSGCEGFLRLYPYLRGVRYALWEALNRFLQEGGDVQEFHGDILQKKYESVLNARQEKYPDPEKAPMVHIYEDPTLPIYRPKQHDLGTIMFEAMGYWREEGRYEDLTPYKHIYDLASDAKGLYEQGRQVYRQLREGFYGNIEPSDNRGITRGVLDIECGFLFEVYNKELATPFLKFFWSRYLDFYDFKKRFGPRRSIQEQKTGIVGDSIVIDPRYIRLSKQGTVPIEFDQLAQRCALGRNPESLELLLYDKRRMHQTIIPPQRSVGRVACRGEKDLTRIPKFLQRLKQGRVKGTDIEKAPFVVIKPSQGMHGDGVRVLNLDRDDIEQQVRNDPNVRLRLGALLIEGFMPSQLFEHPNDGTQHDGCGRFLQDMIVDRRDGKRYPLFSACYMRLSPRPWKGAESSVDACKANLTGKEPAIPVEISPLVTDAVARVTEEISDRITKKYLVA